MKELLPLLPRPTRYLGSEWGSPDKDPDSVALRLGLAFPDLYEVGMSYQGQKILLDLANSREDCLAERVFSPCRETSALLRGHGAPRATPLCTLETDTPLADLDALAFSLTHELCYTNVLEMLDLAGIPLHADQRGPEHPLVIAGGGVVCNAEPVAPFFDLMALGDGEATLPLILERMARAKRQGTGRNELLRSLAGEPGIYVPSLFQDSGSALPPTPLLPEYDHVDRAILPDLDAAPHPTAQPIPLAQAVHERLALEVARGCSRGCRFCQAGMIYRPVRERSPETLARLLDEGLRATGYEETSLLSLSTGDYSALEEVFTSAFDRCRAEQVSIALPSLRVGSLTPGIMRRIASIRRTGATLAPEAGSQRMRDVINKNVTEQALLDHVRHLFESGWQMVKLYFMIGLPTETDEDLKAMADLCVKVRDIAGPRVKRLQVTASVSPFVPKPHTPFQWQEQMDLTECRRRIGLLRDLFRPLKRIKLKFHEPEMSFLEGIFSRGDRRLAPVVEQAWRGGALFSSWKDQLDLRPYLEALTDHGLAPEQFLAARDPDGPLPWDHLHAGPSKGFLKAEWAKAQQARTVEDCRFGRCAGCGVCTDKPGRTPTNQLQGTANELGAEAISPRQANPVDTDPTLAPRSLSREQESTSDRPGHDQAADQDAPRQDAPGLTAPDLTVKGGHYRIWFEKTGPAAYLSQLELQSTLERALRRARLPLTFSGGFHPMPRMSFGRALPVGVDSLCEWFTLYLREALEPEAVQSALAPLLPGGLCLTRVEAIDLARKVPQAVGESFVLEYTGEDAADRVHAWQGFSQAESMTITRRTKRGQRDMDIRPLVFGLALSGHSVRLDLDWNQGYLNPLTLVRAVDPQASPLDFRLTKVEQRLGKARN